MSETKLLEILRNQDVDYGEVTLKCTYSKGKLAKVVVIEKQEIVLMS